jgi:hypothetical protein
MPLSWPSGNDPSREDHCIARRGQSVPHPAFRRRYADAPAATLLTGLPTANGFVLTLAVCRCSSFYGTLPLARASRLPNLPRFACAGRVIPLGLRLLPPGLDDWQGCR